MIRLPILSLFAICAAAADLPLTGSWAGAKPAIADGACVVIAVYDRSGTCCGGPAAALAGLANLRDSLKDRPATVLIAVDSTKDVSVATAQAGAAEFKLEGIPLLVDPARATGNAFGAETDVTIRYVVVRPDGKRINLESPAQVRRELGM